ncbi:penicillin binding protein PBP4B [Erysipelothrix aquatica]|uniref:penicillin binding protein PBP4B n=1 Tax=Erysipelothrix aquatica TaxID=2683714 RepID=UPI00135CC541|nr:penicillin binding protein PBP4B [Erysipelothrix aquatica]
MKYVSKVVSSTLLVFAMLLTIVTPINAETSAPVAKPEMFELLDQIITAETRYGLTGVQVAVTKDGSLVKNSAYGYTNNYKNVYDENGASILDQIEVLPLAQRTKVTPDTLFDLASNTKMYATVYAMQRLVDQGKITLDTTVVSIFPEFVNDGRGVQSKHLVTVGHLLRHDAGFTPDPQYHNQNYTGNLESDGSNYLFSQDRDLTLEMMLKTPLLSEPGSVVKYSDVDFMLLGAIVEAVSGQRLDTYVYENFYQPLGLDSLVFNPLDHGFTTQDTVSSELHGNTRDGRISFENERTEVVTGQVHDEKAFYSMGGISGHAGLFGTAQDVAILATAMLNQGTVNGQTFFTQDTIDKFVAPSTLNDTYGYGWRRQGDTNGYGWAFSNFASKNTIGHTGWTGTLTLIDPDNNVTLALMTNSRNTPIMGPGANDFYTKNFNTNAYGMVSELVYQALGLGDDTTAHEYLVGMIQSEFSTLTSTSTPSKRNALRALISVLETRAPHDTQASAYLQSDEVQNMITILEPTFAEDTKYLVFEDSVDVSGLETLLEQAKAIDTNLYTPESVATLTDATTEATTLLATGNYTQEAVDALIVKLQAALDNLIDIEVIPTVDKANLKEAIERATAIDTAIYTKDTLDALKVALEQAQIIFKDDTATQSAVDQTTLTLNNAIRNLKLTTDKETPTTPEGTLPATGMQASNLVFVAAAFIVLGVILRKYSLRQK